MDRSDGFQGRVNKGGKQKWQRLGSQSTKKMKLF